MALDFEKLSKEQKDNAYLIGSKAEKAGVDPNLALALAWQENRFNSKGLSPKGAVGIMQIMPDTAKLYGYTKDDLNDKNHNIDLGLTILKDHLTTYDNNPRASLVAYNAGSKVADRFLKNKEDPKFLPEETKNYLESIDAIHPLVGDAGISEATTQEMPSLFEPTEALPEHLKTDPKRASESAWERNLRVGQEAVQENPEAAGAILGGAAGYKQWQFNKELAKKMQAKAEQAAKTAGEKWAEKIGGPGGQTVTEAAENLHLERSLGPGETLTKSGIALPQSSRIQLENELKAQSKKFLPRAKNIAQNIGEFVKFPGVNVLGGLGAGHNISQAIERGKEGDYVGAGISGVEAGLNAMAALPVTANPYLLGAKGIGTVGSLGMIPIDILYNKYKERSAKKPVVEVGQPTIKP
jgi:hypothetical protein